MAKSPLKIVLLDDLGSSFSVGEDVPNKITVKKASTSEEGVSKLATPADVTYQSSGVVVDAKLLAQTLNAAIAALPADRYVRGLVGYNANTNQITFDLGDGMSSSVDLTAVVLDAVAEALANNLGPFTRNIEIAKSWPTLALNKTAVAQSNLFRGAASGLDRWVFEMGNGAPETGSNAGSEFALVRCADNGAWIDAPLWVRRSDGMTHLVKLTLNGQEQRSLGTGSRPVLTV